MRSPEKQLAVDLAPLPERPIDLSERKHIRQRPLPLEDEDLIFPGPRTGGVFYGSYLRAIVAKASESCKFKHVVPYGLRHSYCVNGIRTTANIEYVAQQMGHKTVQTTLGIYNRHVTNAGRMRSARALEESFGLMSTLGQSEEPAD